MPPIHGQKYEGYPIGSPGTVEPGADKPPSQNPKCERLEPPDDGGGLPDPFDSPPNQEPSLDLKPPDI